MRLKPLLKILLALLIVAIITVICSNIWVISIGQRRLTSSPNFLKPAQAILILGAKVNKDGRLSNILQDRVDTGLSLYQLGYAPKILVSGDHGQIDYDEVNAMKDYLLEKGVKPEDIFMDHAGFDTFDSIYRAREIFKIKSLIIVTQSFHLYRAIYLADQLGLEVQGLASDKREYLGQLWNDAREALARTKAVFDIVTQQKSRLGGPAIPISGDGHLSWD